MNEKIKAQWIEALRNGGYARAHGQLHLGDGFSCFGVLCDIHAKATAGEWELPADSKIDYRYLGCCRRIPREVLKWAGLKLNGAEHLVFWNKKEGDESRDIDLHILDLAGESFIEIARILETFA